MRYKVLLGILTFLLLSMPVAFAEWYDGEVQEINLKAGTLTINEIDPITDTEEAEEIVIEPATTFSGVKSLKDLRKGDNVSIEAKYDEPTDAWKAVSVEMAEAGE